MSNTEKTQLLFGPYREPALKVGDRTMCLVRDAEVVIYDWSLGPIPWPLCYRAGTRAAGKGLLVDEELARAIRHESAAAISHWWGVCGVVVGRWRRALGVDRKNNPGTYRLVRGAVDKAATVHREVRFRPGRLEHCREVYASKNNGVGPTYRGAPWTAEELALLGSLPDDQVAARIGRTVAAVIGKRERLHIPMAPDSRPKERASKSVSQPTPLARPRQYLLQVTCTDEKQQQTLLACLQALGLQCDVPPS
jgi:hypothetical protein